MEQKTKLMLAGAAVVLIAAAVVAAPYLLPQDSVQLDESLPPDASEEATITVHRAGQWQDGDSRHHGSGTVELVTVDGEAFVRFTDFQLTAGPDVYLYLTESATPESTADVEGNGLRILVQTEQDPDGRLNERGTFFVPLEMSLAELDAYQGLAAWCDNFNVLFANAALS